MPHTRDAMVKRKEVEGAGFVSDLPKLPNYLYPTSPSLQKAKTPTRAVLHPRGRRNFLVRRRLYWRWARSYPYPGSIPNSSKGPKYALPAQSCQGRGGPREEDRGDLAARVVGRRQLDPVTLRDSLQLVCPKLTESRGVR